jgi:hypothetical protein
MSQESTPTTWSVMANEAGNESATTEVLYSGLTRAEAYSTAIACRDMDAPADQGKYNYYIQRDAK